jgi:hypothetical protein
MAADDIGTETIGEFVAARRAAGYSSQLTGRSLAWMLGYLRGLGAVRLAGTPASEPKPSKAGPGRPKGPTSTPAARHPVIKKAA